MASWKQLLVLSALTISLATAVAIGQMAAPQPAAGEVIIGIYRIAPGKQVEFLRWMAAREAVNKELGLPSAQWYVHENGDSWDFLGLLPVTTPEQDAKIEALIRKKGLKDGLAGSFELRQYLASHTDTFARGPQTAAEILKAAGES